MKLYKALFFVKDTTLPSDSPLRFRKTYHKMTVLTSEYVLRETVLLEKNATIKKLEYSSLGSKFNNIKD